MAETRDARMNDARAVADALLAGRAVIGAEHTEKLDLSRRELTALPRTLSQFSALKDLYVFDNQLAVLPGWIGVLRSLEALSRTRYAGGGGREGGRVVKCKA